MISEVKDIFNIVTITCPSCKNKGSLEISDELIKKVSRGLLAVNVASDIICEHSFIAYVDKNLSIRDYFIADFQIEIPEIAPSGKFETKETLLRDNLNLDAIRLNLSANLITHALKSIFLNKKIVIVSDLTFLNDQISNFFKQLLDDSFEVNISVISENEYKSNKKNYKDSIVLDGKKVVRDDKKIINPKKLKVEKQMVSKFMMDFDPVAGYLGLKNEISNILRLSQSIVDFASNFRKDVKIDSELIIDHLEKEYNFKIDKTYLEFLLRIVDVNFGVKNIRSAGIQDYLKYSTTGFRP